MFYFMGEYSATEILALYPLSYKKISFLDWIRTNDLSINSRSNRYLRHPNCFVYLNDSGDSLVISFQSLSDHSTRLSLTSNRSAFIAQIVF